MNLRIHQHKCNFRWCNQHAKIRAHKGRFLWRGKFRIQRHKWRFLSRNKFQGFASTFKQHAFSDTLKLRIRQRKGRFHSQNTRMYPSTWRTLSLTESISESINIKQAFSKAMEFKHPPVWRALSLTETNQGFAYMKSASCQHKGCFLRWIQSKDLPAWRTLSLTEI